ncbi:hypothetical protein ACNQR7_31205 [Mycolicibacterium senegalense]|uniref:hypothetical protein n=1 Tax=Mycolicibacterium senegalense TaxID=1796 RepID=UPI003AADE371
MGMGNRWSRSSTLIAVGLAVLGLTAAPVASSTPGVPDLSGYTAVNSEDYRSEMGYGTSGVRFSTPDGLHCTMTHNARSSWDMAQCAGPLSGVADLNTARVVSFGSPGELLKSDLSSDTVSNLDGQGWHETPVAPGAYKVLTVGMKISFESATCAVGDRRLTTCVIAGGQTFGDHGFVLGIGGGRVF